VLSDMSALNVGRCPLLHPSTLATVRGQAGRRRERECEREREKCVHVCGGLGRVFYVSLQFRFVRLPLVPQNTYRQVSARATDPFKIGSSDSNRLFLVFAKSTVYRAGVAHQDRKGPFYAATESSHQPEPTNSFHRSEIALIFIVLVQGKRERGRERGKGPDRFRITPLFLK